MLVSDDDFDDMVISVDKFNVHMSTREGVLERSVRFELPIQELVASIRQVLAFHFEETLCTVLDTRTFAVVGQVTLPFRPWYAALSQCGRTVAAAFANGVAMPVYPSLN